MVWSSRLKDSLAPVTAAAGAAGAALVDGGAELGLVGVALIAGGVALVTNHRQRQLVERQAEQLASKEREASVVAETASALLAAPSTKDAVAPHLERALSDVGARLQICHAPAPQSGEIALPLKAGSNQGWLYVDREGPLSRDEAERLLSRIADLVTAAQQRAQVHQTAAEVEAQRHAELEKTAVMHAVSHDLRVPLAGLGAVSQALADESLDDESRRHLAQSLARETAQLERMVDDLLDLSRIEAGATNPQPESCDLAEIVAGAAERVRSQRGEFDVRLSLPDGLPAVEADRAQLERVFCNLLDNAAKFSPADRTVEVRGICANGRVTIRVLDHGQGIAPAQQSQVFKAFVRGSSPESGSGMGLAICRGFVEANGGRITLQSGARDGSAFAVSFPTADQPSAVR